MRAEWHLHAYDGGSEMKELIVVGNGKLADTIVINFPAYSTLSVKRYFSGIRADDESVFVHIGSGRQYEESLTAALHSGAAYIQAATEKDIAMKEPPSGTITYVNAPNLDIRIIKFIYLLRIAGELFHGDHITVTESHQAEKKSLPGTALKFCEYLGVPKESLVSIRDPAQQRKMSINSLQQHAYHRISIGDEDSSLCFETKIDGALSYVKGMAVIVKCLDRLEKKNFMVEDLVAMHLLD